MISKSKTTAVKMIACLCALTLIFCGCADKDADFAEDDPITDYDSVENVRVEGVGGYFTVREKKYPFGNGSLAVLRVDNATGKNVSIQIDGTFEDSDGNAVRSETKRFLDFSANDSNYFFFDPGIAFDGFSYEIKLLESDARDFSACWSFNTHAHAERFDDGAQASPEYRDDAVFKTTMKCAYPPESLNIDVCVLTFDNEGLPAYIVKAGRATVTTDLHTIAKDACELKDGKYVLPENLQGELRCVTSMGKIWSEAEWNEHMEEIMRGISD